MASPQKENGFTGIANELIEMFCRVKMPEYERVIVLYIWRKTYGFGKKEDWISNSQFVKATGIDKSNISRGLRNLKKKKIVVCRDNKYLSVNKNWEEWTVVCRDNLVVSHATGSCLLRNHKRNNTKETFKKKNMRLEDSRKFLSDYEEVIDANGDRVVSPYEEEKNKKAEEVRAVSSVIDAHWKYFSAEYSEPEKNRERIDVPTLRKKVKDALKLYTAEELISFMPYYFADDYYTQFGHALMTMLSVRTLNKLKNEKNK